MVNTEVNSIGAATQSRLLMSLQYPNLYRWAHFDDPTKLTLKNGYVTNQQTKPLLIGNFKMAVRELLWAVRSKGLLEEMSAYVIKNGLYATTDLPSDRIMAAALSWACISQTEFGYHQQIVMGSKAITKARELDKKEAPKESKLKKMQRALPAELNNNNNDLEHFSIENIFDDALFF